MSRRKLLAGTAGVAGAAVAAWALSADDSPVVSNKSHESLHSLKTGIFKMTRARRDAANKALFEHSSLLYLLFRYTNLIKKLRIATTYQTRCFIR